MSAPVYLLPMIVTTNSVIVTLILTGLWLALYRAPFTHERRMSLMFRASLMLIAWFALAMTLGYNGSYDAQASRWPTIQFGILIPLFIGLGILWRSKAALSILDAVPQHWLIGVQFYRIFGIAFILLMNEGYLPRPFALPAGWGDIAVGLLAPLVALMLVRAMPGARALAISWNVLGLADLVIAVTMGFLTSPSPLQTLSLNAPNELISNFPLVMVPTFAVPVSFLLHVASLTRLYREREAQAIKRFMPR